MMVWSRLNSTDTFGLYNAICKVDTSVSNVVEWTYESVKFAMICLVFSTSIKVHQKCHMLLMIDVGYETCHMTT